MALAEQIGFGRRYRVIVVDPDRSTADAMARMLTGEHMTCVGTATHGEDALTMVADYRPDAVLLDQGLGRPSALDVAARVLKTLPGTWIFLTAHTPTPELWRDAQAVGVRAVLPKPYGLSEVLEAVARAEEDDRRHGVIGVARSDIPAPAFVGGVPVRAIRQEIVAVWGSKGGVGKTTLAVNLAASFVLQRSVGLRVAVVDFDTDSAGISAELGLPVVRPERSVADWVGVPSDSLDRARVEQLLVRHQSGLWVLPAPGSPVEALGVPSDVYERIIEALRRHFDIVVLDLPVGYRHDAAIAGLKAASLVLFVTSPDTASVAKMHQTCALLRNDIVHELGIDPSKFRLVISLKQKSGGHPIPDVVQFADFPAIGVPIPEDPRVRRHANVEQHGRPAIEVLGSTPWAAAVRSVARSIVPIDFGEARLKGRSGRKTPLLRRLFRHGGARA